MNEKGHFSEGHRKRDIFVPTPKYFNEALHCLPDRPSFISISSFQKERESEEKREKEKEREREREICIYRLHIYIHVVT